MRRPRGVWAKLVALGVGLLGVFVLDRVAAWWIPPPKTTLFERDAELGWRFRPGAVDEWSGVTVRINAKGLRGPELPYERTPGRRRILFLGDSVTVGFGLKRDADAFPALTAARLQELTGARTEAVNAAVNGYSPWQEAAYLRREGSRYSPDVVVVGFVLNDVTEALGLRVFGGTGEGHQLEGSVTSTLDGWARHSGLVRLGLRAGALLRFGRDAPSGAARAETLDARDLVASQTRPDVESAWRSTLRELDGIVAWCRERRTPLLIVVFPYAFQLGAGGEPAPQARLAAFARERGLASLDLLPLLSRAAARQRLPPHALFLDASHPSELGHRLVADAVADAILERRLLPAAREQGGSGADSNLGSTRSPSESSVQR